jgi:ferredoxin
MSDMVERTVDDLKVVVQRGLCVMFAQCVDVAEDAFEVGDDDVVAFTTPERVERERLIEACRVCPVEALLVFDADGKQLVP